MAVAHLRRYLSIWLEILR